MREKGAELHPEILPRIFLLGIDLRELPVGTVLAIGEALLAVTQIGKTPSS